MGIINLYQLAFTYM